LILYRNSLPWDYFSAFMGAESTGQILTSDKRVILSISGHSHIRKQASVNGLTAITVPLGYGRPPDDDFSSLIRDAIAEIRIENNAVTLTHFMEGDICESLPYDF
ncbi:MAG: hypothetical protein ACFFEF_16360, partial [Candidatus Thorarchaeota archaeon]